MPTNVTGMTPSVQATERTQETKGDKLSVKRDGGGSAGSAFSPRTDVSIKNSIDNMAGILSKISSHQSEAENAIPSQLKEIINNIMRSAFSLEGTVGEGVGSSLASQKFSVEQLNTLSRMLHHLGYLSDQGSLGELSEDLQVVFDNIKLAIGKESNIEPVNLNKLAFQLIQNEDNPQAVKQIEELLSQLASLTVSQPGATAAQPSEGFALLNKLVDAFFLNQCLPAGQSKVRPVIASQPIKEIWALLVIPRGLLCHREMPNLAQRWPMEHLRARQSVRRFLIQIRHSIKAMGFQPMRQAIWLMLLITLHHSWLIRVVPATQQLILFQQQLQQGLRLPVLWHRARGGVGRRF